MHQACSVDATHRGDGCSAKSNKALSPPCSKPTAGPCPVLFSRASWKTGLALAPLRGKGMTENGSVPNNSPQFADSRFVSHLVSHRKAWELFPNKTSHPFERGETGTLKGESVLPGGERWSWRKFSARVVHWRHLGSCNNSLYLGQPQPFPKCQAEPSA